ncbi:MAG TPA: type II toxin-antitoxin system VapC family toxin [Phycisphaerae bacterium]|nr:type II toxin-antitoxin system VapC family toxin [Phycisphaerae bacterium]
MIVLDTDHVTLLQEGDPLAERIHQRLVLLGANQHFPISIVTYEEQMRGWMDRLTKRDTMAREIQTYRKLEAHVAFYSTVAILAFTEWAAVEFQRLRKLKVRIGTMDLKIAAIALSLHATLWTRNRRDFEKVPALRFEDATR